MTKSIHSDWTAQPRCSAAAYCYMMRTIYSCRSMVSLIASTSADPNIMCLLCNCAAVWNDYRLCAEWERLCIVARQYIQLQMYLCHFDSTQDIDRAQGVEMYLINPFLKCGSWYKTIRYPTKESQIRHFNMHLGKMRDKGLKQVFSSSYSILCWMSLCYLSVQQAAVPSSIFPFYFSFGLFFY